MKYSDFSVAVCLALSLIIQTAPVSFARKPVLKSAPAPQALGYEKLTTGAGPDTNDSKSDSKADTESGAAPSQAVPEADQAKIFAPVTLKDEEKTEAKAEDADNSQSSLLKSSVTATGFIPKGPLDHDSALTNPTSIKSKSLSSYTDRAKQVNLMPLPLQESQEESDKKEDAKLTAERRQLSDLWEATLARSNDIQFVIQKLMPTSKHGHTASVMYKLLNSAICGGMAATSMMVPNAGGYMVSSAAGSMLMNAVGAADNANAKKARLSETESIMLYKLVRETADHLVDNFHNYKKNLEVFSRANEDLSEHQATIAKTRDSQPLSEQVRLDWELKTAERQVYAISEDVRRYRQALVDISGAEAVQKLDQQIDEESVIVNGAPLQKSAPTETQPSDAPPKETASKPAAEDDSNTTEKPKATAAKPSDKPPEM